MYESCASHENKRPPALNDRVAYAKKTYSDNAHVAF